MTTSVILNIKSPDVGTALVGANVKLRNKDGAIIGIDHTNAAGQVAFNVPTALPGAYVTIDSVGEIATFDIPASGVITGAILFDGRVKQMAATQTFVITWGILCGILFILDYFFSLHFFIVHKKSLLSLDNVKAMLPHGFLFYEHSTARFLAYLTVFNTITSFELIYYI